MPKYESPKFNDRIFKVIIVPDMLSLMQLLLSYRATPFPHQQSLLGSYHIHFLCNNAPYKNLQEQLLFLLSQYDYNSDLDFQFFHYQKTLYHTHKNDSLIKTPPYNIKKQIKEEALLSLVLKYLYFKNIIFISSIFHRCIHLQYKTYWRYLWEERLYLPARVVRL